MYEAGARDFLAGEIDNGFDKVNQPEAILSGFLFDLN